MVLVVFATNIKPAELVDEAFLRRIHYKVFAESPTVAEFTADFRELLPRARYRHSIRRWWSICCRTTTDLAASRSAAAIPAI